MTNEQAQPASAPRRGYEYWDRLCRLPKYSFLLIDGGVRKVADTTGRWIERDAAQEVMDLAQTEINVVRDALQKLLACHEQPAGLTPEVALNKEGFAGFLALVDARIKAAVDNARDALNSGLALPSGEAVTGPSETEVKFCGVDDTQRDFRIRQAGYNEGFEAGRRLEKAQRLTVAEARDALRLPPVAAPADGFKVVPKEFLTHRWSWRIALENALNRADYAEDVSYWSHQLRAFDRAYTDLAAATTTSEAALEQALAERDDYHDMADKLADAIAEHFGVDIGEHSSANNPWLAALEAFPEAAVTEAQVGEDDEPVAWFAFGDSNGPVPLELWGWDRKACLHAVLENARSIGWKGTVNGYLLEQGWSVRPVWLHPYASQAHGKSEAVAWMPSDEALLAASKAYLEKKGPGELRASFFLKGAHMVRDAFLADRAQRPAAPADGAALAESLCLRRALFIAEAALADIGDADREPGDDLAWCEKRAAQDLPMIRAALALAQGEAAQQPEGLREAFDKWWADGSPSSTIPGIAWDAFKAGAALAATPVREAEPAPAHPDARDAALKTARAHIKWLAFGECRADGWEGAPPTAAEAVSCIAAALAAFGTPQEGGAA